MTGRTWSLTIPAPADWLSSNHRRDRRAETSDRQAWRQAAGWRAKAAKLHTLNLNRACITAWVHFGDQRRRDSHNYAPTIKAAIDGLVDVGVLVADDDQHLLSVQILRGVNETPRAVVLVIEEVE